MRGVHGKAYINLDPLLPVHLLDIEAIELELAESERVITWWGTGDKDFSKFHKAPNGSSERVQSFWKKHEGNKKILEAYSKLAYGVYSPTYSVRIAKQLRFDYATTFGQEVDNPSFWQRNHSVFPSIQKVLDESQAFEYTGRMVFFVQDHHCPVPLHCDYPHPDCRWPDHYQAQVEKEFIWLSPRADKGFYVWDEMAKIQHLVTSKSAWFNALDLHGSVAVPRQTWSLRIDGKFTEDFRNKVASLTM